MANEDLKIETTSENGGKVRLLNLSGSLDVATCGKVREALAQATQEGCHDLIVDLSHLEFLDSTGLGALIGAHRRAAEHGGQVRLVVTEGTIARLLNITGLVRVFAVYASLKDALEGRSRVTTADAKPSS
ncbi:MAG TPA: STAS domain-containing protein [Candidatus Tyrphobacter sp.]